MASVGSLSSSTSNSIRGYGGLASGLDRDELIKGMTLGTTSKLNQQEQKNKQQSSDHLPGSGGLHPCQNIIHHKGDDEYLKYIAYVNRVRICGNIPDILFCRL